MVSNVGIIYGIQFTFFDSTYADTFDVTLKTQENW